MGKGKFIVLEGCEGAGKSRQSKLLTEALVERGYDVVATREPGGTALAEALRALILDPNHSPDATAELYMYSAARRDHLNKVVFPALDDGKIVVCDRFTYSTLAYQGYGRGLDIDFVRRVNESTISPLTVDLALFLDVNPVDGFKRKGGADKADRLEREDLAFFERVYGGFKDMCGRGELTAIDASGTKQETAEKILREVLRIL
ncbi:MAG: dTMP kinase [Clostridiales bacterium]|nr:dTMP kinase [Clostridiales bacterium]